MSTLKAKSKPTGLSGFIVLKSTMYISLKRGRFGWVTHCAGHMCIANTDCEEHKLSWAEDSPYQRYHMLQPYTRFVLELFLPYGLHNHKYCIEIARNLVLLFKCLCWWNHLTVHKHFGYFNHVWTHRFHVLTQKKVLSEHLQIKLKSFSLIIIEDLSFGISGSVWVALYMSCFDLPHLIPPWLHGCGEYSKNAAKQLFWKRMLIELKRRLLQWTFKKPIR